MKDRVPFLNLMISHVSCVILSALCGILSYILRSSDASVVTMFFMGIFAVIAFLLYIPMMIRLITFIKAMNWDI